MDVGDRVGERRSRGTSPSTHSEASKRNDCWRRVSTRRMKRFRLGYTTILLRSLSLSLSVSVPSVKFELASLTGERISSSVQDFLFIISIRIKQRRVIEKLNAYRCWINYRRIKSRRAPDVAS